ncbi:class I SAM-dependent methyltransferase [Amycolatopsis sp. QT-25]|uniref:class I SAM-dependent methyltransferase n=1 Tax=Amycolatopsis sp. QT-25 TaxID=3034022 RepID=UPI0023EADB0C|nr:class I SAM-dependent methyltransferase [Amycolatopsis sp. QT-25]WET76804.1 class I SAM-dependent methyltransferase [Amycolatopsis sp. QT-25]
MSQCRVCGASVTLFLDLGNQPLSDVFPAGTPGSEADEFFYRLRVGACTGCAMVQLLEEVPRERMFGDHYPYRSSGSAVMRRHFTALAKRLLALELSGRDDPFVVELGCNDGVMLRTLARAQIRHLGVEPSVRISQTAVECGVQVLNAYFDQETAVRISAEHGPADVIYAANTLCHIPYVTSVLDGVAELLTDDGVFVFEDPYLGDIVASTSFDQIYDEHFFLFSATTVARLAERHGLALVDVERLPVHGGELRYTLARAGKRRAGGAVAELVAEEAARGLHTPEALSVFATAVRRNAHDLVELLSRLRGEGRTIAAYGATAKSATVTNYCNIGPELVSVVYDTTPEKQGRVTPGTHIPVTPAAEFADPYPDYAVLFAWNHAAEIMTKETGFTDHGGRWITYVPEVRVL